MGGCGEAQQIQVGASDVGEASLWQILPEHNVLWKTCTANGDRHRCLHMPTHLFELHGQVLYDLQHAHMLQGMKQIAHL